MTARLSTDPSRTPANMAPSKLPKPAQNDRDEALGQGGMAHPRADRKDRGEQCRGECGHGTADPEGQRVDPLEVDPHQGCGIAVLRDRPKPQAEPGLLGVHPEPEHHERGDEQDHQPLVGKPHPHDLDRALDVVREGS